MYLNSVHTPGQVGDCKSYFEAFPEKAHALERDVYSVHMRNYVRSVYTVLVDGQDITPLEYEQVRA